MEGIEKPKRYLATVNHRGGFSYFLLDQVDFYSDPEPETNGNGSSNGNYYFACNDRAYPIAWTLRREGNPEVGQTKKGKFLPVTLPA